MIRTKDELMKALTDMIGEATDDVSIALLEDADDTLNNYDNELADKTNWKVKYEENDAEWRRKYIARFNGKVESDEDFVEKPTAADDEEVIENEKPKTYEDLFSVGEE